MTESNTPSQFDKDEFSQPQKSAPKSEQHYSSHTKEDASSQTPELDNQRRSSLRIDEKSLNMTESNTPSQFENDEFYQSQNSAPNLEQFDSSQQKIDVSSQTSEAKSGRQRSPSPRSHGKSDMIEDDTKSASSMTTKRSASPKSTTKRNPSPRTVKFLSYRIELNNYLKMNKNNK